MGAGEYVLVSTQRNTEKALIENERHELATEPEFEYKELVAIYVGKGLSSQTASYLRKSLHSTMPLPRTWMQNLVLIQTTSLALCMPPTHSRPHFLRRVVKLNEKSFMKIHV